MDDGADESISQPASQSQSLLKTRHKVFVDYLLRRIHPDESRRHDADPTPAAVVRSPSPPPSPAVSSDVARPHLVSRLYTVTERPRDYVAVDADDDVAASGEDSRTSDDDEESQPEPVKKRRNRHNRKWHAPADDNTTSTDSVGDAKRNRSEPISKNRKRKLKKKRHKDRLKSSVDVSQRCSEFTYASPNQTAESNIALDTVV